MFLMLRYLPAYRTSNFVLDSTRADLPEERPIPSLKTHSGDVLDLSIRGLKPFELLEKPKFGDVLELPLGIVRAFKQRNGRV